MRPFQNVTIFDLIKSNLIVVFDPCKDLVIIMDKATQKKYGNLLKIYFFRICNLLIDH
jgi:hypothetical protein